MTIQDHKWSDLKKWVMGIVGALITAMVIGYFSIDTGEVNLKIASQIDDYGRCIDRELLITNETKVNAEDIVLSFDVDYFTKQGSVAIEYGDEREVLITSAMITLLPRKPYYPITHSLDYENSQLKIPMLKPNEYIHFHFGGESVIDLESQEKRVALLSAKQDELMNKPRLISATRKDAVIKVIREIECENLMTG